MTKAGGGFIGAGLFVYLLASQTQIGWLYFFDAIIWSLLLLSAILSWWSLRPLQIERQVILPRPDPRQRQLGGPLESEAIEVRLKIANNGRLARHFIKVVEECPFDRPEEHQRAFLITSLNPAATRTFSYTATAYRRGYYPSSKSSLEYRGPLGLVVRRRTFPLALKLTVYPTYYLMEGLPPADTAWAEWGHAVKSSSAAELYGSREYRHGDPLKHIHWRNTARSGGYMLKEFEQASQGSVTVAFETKDEYGVDKETTLEYSTRIAASLARLSTDSGRSLDIFAGQTPLSRAGWREAMDYLAHLRAAGGTALAELASASLPDQTVVAIVPAREPGLIPVLTQLARRVRRLEVVLLEGFTPDEEPGLFLSQLKGGNTNVLSCPQGDLTAAIENLGNTLIYDTKIASPTG